MSGAMLEFRRSPIAQYLLEGDPLRAGDEIELLLDERRGEGPPRWLRGWFEWSHRSTQKPRFHFRIDTLGSGVEQVISFEIPAGAHLRRVQLGVLVR